MNKITDGDGSLVQRLRAERHLLGLLSADGSQCFDVTISRTRAGDWIVTTRDRHHVQPAPPLKGRGETFAAAWNAQQLIEPADGDRT